MTSGTFTFDWPPWRSILQFYFWNTYINCPSKTYQNQTNDETHAICSSFSNCLFSPLIGPKLGISYSHIEISYQKSKSQKCSEFNDLYLPLRDQLFGFIHVRVFSKISLTSLMSRLIIIYKYISKNSLHFSISFFKLLFT